MLSLHEDCYNFYFKKEKKQTHPIETKDINKSGINDKSLKL